MKSSKKAKNALLFSVVSIALCVAMLVGATFAWFTDSVTNTGNSISAGTLDVELTDGSDKTLFSGDGVLWEPGFSQMHKVTVENAGNLWLKYSLNFADVVVKGSSDYPDADLTQVLDVYKVDKESATVDDLKAENYLGTMAQLMQGGAFGEGKDGLAPGNSDTFTLVIKMQESAGNEYKNASVSFSVKVLATQYTSETDGFGNKDYDKDATYADVTVSDTTQLQNAIANAQDGDIIALAANTTFGAEDGSTRIQIDKDLTLVGEEGTKFHGTIVSANPNNLPPEEYPSLTVEGVEFVSGTYESGVSTGSAIGDTYLKEVTLEGCTVNYGNYPFVQGDNEIGGDHSVRYTLLNNTFVSTVDTDSNYYPIYTWSSIADGSVISGNTFGTEDQPIYGWAFRLMNVDDGATITVSDNQVYCSSGSAFAFYNNADQPSRYKIIFDHNTTVAKDGWTDHRDGDKLKGFAWIASRVNREDIHATVVLKGENTLTDTDGEHTITAENYSDYFYLNTYTPGTDSAEKDFNIGITVTEEP